MRFGHEFSKSGTFSKVGAVFVAGFLALSLPLAGCKNQEQAQGVTPDSAVEQSSVPKASTDESPDIETESEEKSLNDIEVEMMQNISFKFTRAEPINDENDFKVYGSLTNDNDQIVNLVNLSFTATMKGEDRYRQEAVGIPAEVDKFAAYDTSSDEYTFDYGYGFHNANGFFNLQPHETRDIFATCRIRPADGKAEADAVDSFALDDFLLSTDFDGTVPTLADYIAPDFSNADLMFMPIDAFSSDVQGVAMNEYGDGEAAGTLTNNSKFYLNNLSAIYLYQGKGLSDDGDIEAYYEFEFEPVAPGSSTPLADTYAPMIPHEGTYTLIGVLGTPSLTP